jgi:hypothetical protein
MDEATIKLHKPVLSSTMSLMSIAELLPQVRGILPLANVAALNRLAATLCDVLESTLTVPPPPANEAVAVPALTPAGFPHAILLDGPQPAKTVERAAQERHGWHPRVLFKARQRLRVKAVRCGFGPSGCWVWRLPDHMTDKDVHFHPGEWRSFIAGHRAGVHRPHMRPTACRRSAYDMTQIEAGLSGDLFRTRTRFIAICRSGNCWYWAELMKPLFHLRRRRLFRWLSNISLTMPVRSKQTGYIVYADLFRNFAFVARSEYEIEEFRSFVLLLDRFRPKSRSENFLSRMNRM